MFLRVAFFVLTKSRLFEKYNCVVTSELLKLPAVLFQLVVQCALCLSSLCITSLCIVLNPTFYYNFL